MIKRSLQQMVEGSLASFPVVGLVGPRQAGKTTLAHAIARNSRQKFIFLDLEKPSDLAKLEDPELYLRNFADRTIILDEIQRRPNLFPVMRALIDEFRRNGRFLILGSASPDLLRQSSESLAGRIVYHELAPFTLPEVGFSAVKTRKLWIRGGFPLSFLAKTAEQSFQWRDAFLSAFLERDIPQLGIRVPSVTLHRFWKMLAHYHGALWNGSAIAGSLGVSPPAARHYLDVLSDTYMIRQLPPYFANIGKRLVKSPKVYIRDSGILCSLLGISTYEEMLNHPQAGAAWEGWILEQICHLIPRNMNIFFYRTAAGAEIDIVLVKGDKPKTAVEIKFSTSPKPGRGFWEGYQTLGCHEGYVIYPGKEKFPLTKGVYALPVSEIVEII